MTGLAAMYVFSVANVPPRLTHLRLGNTNNRVVELRLRLQPDRYGLPQPSSLGSFGEGNPVRIGVLGS